MEYQLSNRTSIKSVADRQIYGNTLPQKLKMDEIWQLVFGKKKKKKEVIFTILSFNFWVSCHLLVIFHPQKKDYLEPQSKIL